MMVLFVNRLLLRETSAVSAKPRTPRFAHFTATKRIPCPLGKLATGTDATQDVSLDGLAIEREDVDTADVLVAVCSRPIRE